MDGHIYRSHVDFYATQNMSWIKNDFCMACPDINAIIDDRPTIYTYTMNTLYTHYTNRTMRQRTRNSADVIMSAKCPFMWQRRTTNRTEHFNIFMRLTNMMGFTFLDFVHQRNGIVAKQNDPNGKMSKTQNHIWSWPKNLLDFWFMSFCDSDEMWHGSIIL